MPCLKSGTALARAHEAYLARMFKASGKFCKIDHSVEVTIPRAKRLSTSFKPLSFSSKLYSPFSTFLSDYQF